VEVEKLVVGVLRKAGLPDRACVSTNPERLGAVMPTSWNGSLFWCVCSVAQAVGKCKKQRSCVEMSRDVVWVSSVEAFEICGVAGIT
jgi:hypothetical protein